MWLPWPASDGSQTLVVLLYHVLVTRSSSPHKNSVFPETASSLRVIASMWCGESLHNMTTLHDNTTSQQNPSRLVQTLYQWTKLVDLSQGHDWLSGPTTRQLKFHSFSRSGQRGTGTDYRKLSEANRGCVFFQLRHSSVQRNVLIHEKLWMHMYTSNALYF